MRSAVRALLRGTPIRSWPLRPKLVAAFSGIALTAALCGLISIFFVNHIARSVSVFSEVTSPLLAESLNLSQNAQKMRATYLEGAEQISTIDRSLERLAELDIEAKQALRRLNDLSAKGGLDVGSASVTVHQERFTQTLQRLLKSQRTEQIAAGNVRTHFAEFEQLQTDLGAKLLRLGARFDGKLIAIEEAAKVQTQTGKATVQSLSDLVASLLTEIYPAAQGMDTLLRERDRLRELSTSFLAHERTDELNAIEQDINGSLRRAALAGRQLMNRLSADDDRNELAASRSAFDEIARVLLAPHGLLVSQKDVIEARIKATEEATNLNTIEQQYLQYIAEVEGAVRGINEQARAEATEGILDGRTVISAVAALTLAFGLFFGLMFARRITDPIENLRNHVVAIRASGDLAPLPDGELAKRSDEIGTLARSFNSMISQLSDARAQLIAESEAEVRTQYERFNAAIDKMPLGFLMIDADQNIIACNSRYAEIYKVPIELTLPGTPLRTVLEHIMQNGTFDGGVEAIDYIVNEITRRDPWYMTVTTSDGKVISVSHKPLANGGAIATHEDITERSAAEAKIAHMAHHDALTDLPNRVLFREELTEALAGIEREGSLGVLCVDLDHFKAVNDTLGHPVGDALLKAVAGRLAAAVRETDVVARLGGDEFAVVQTGTEQPVGATSLATRIIAELSKPYDLDGHQVVVGASVGIAVAPNDGTDPDKLLKNADLALYRAKADGRATYRFFEPEMDAKMQARREMEVDLRRALMLEEFEVYYQPLVCLATDEISGFEALLRWRHPEKGMVPPMEFVSVAEDIGLIGQIGAWVLKTACTQAASWPKDVRIAVNLSAAQFKQRAIALDVAAALGASGLPAHRLELEITETVLLHDTESTVSVLNELRDLGVRISMDDFGTGYSSLGYLRKFPFDKIKIDRSFVGDLPARPESIAIVRAVAGLGSSLGMTTTAEGVETEEQLAQVKLEGCTEVQGYLFSKPVPSGEVVELLRTKKATKAAA